MLRAVPLCFGAVVALADTTAAAGNERAAELVAAARALASAPTVYDASYRLLDYPGGDPPPGVGVCTDLIVRAYRQIGVDLQVLVHEDIKKRFADYRTRKHYRQKKPDANIDHRRVTNLQTFLRRHAGSLPAQLDAQWQPGDIVVFDLNDNGGHSHIGIVSDQKGPSGRPLVFHHFPPHPREDDCLATWTINGHFRFLPP